MGKTKPGVFVASDLRLDTVCMSSLRIKGSSRWFLWRHFKEPAGLDAAARSAIDALRGDCIRVGDKLLMADPLGCAHGASPYMSGRCDVRFLWNASPKDIQSRDWGLLLSFDGTKRGSVSDAAVAMQDWKDKSLASKQVGSEPTLRPEAVRGLGLPRKIPPLMKADLGASVTFGPMSVLGCKESELAGLFKDYRLRAD